MADYIQRGLGWRASNWQYSCDFMGTGLRCGRLRSPRKQPRLAEVRGAGDLNLYSDVAAADLHPSIVFCSQQPLSTADPGIFEGCPHSQGGVGDGEAKVKVRGLPRTLLALAGQAPPPFNLQCFLHPEMYVETWPWKRAGS